MKHLVIIGGTRGLGRALALLMADSDVDVTVMARTEPKAKIGDRFIPVDVTNENSLAEGLQRAVSEGGAINGLAMFQQFRGKEDAWNNKLACILGATRAVLERAPETFAKEGDKAVVLLTSQATRFACDEQDEGYHAAKTGLLGLCRHYALKLGKLGIRVNCVSPGTVLKEESKQFILNDAALHQRFKEIIPLRRMGTADEVATVIRFLLSPDASFITGQEIVVDGGASLRSAESLARSLGAASRTS